MFYFTCNESRIFESFAFWNVTLKKWTFSRHSNFEMHLYIGNGLISTVCSNLCSGSLVLWLPILIEKEEKKLDNVQRQVRNAQMKWSLVETLTNPPQVSQNVGLLYVVSWKLWRLWRLKPSLAHTDIPRMKYEVISSLLISPSLKIKNKAWWELIWFI